MVVLALASAFATGEDDVAELIEIWAERCSIPGIYLEFLDIFLQSYQKKAPLKVIMWKEGLLVPLN